MVDLLWSAPGALREPAIWLGQLGAPWSDELSHAVIEFLRRDVPFTMLVGMTLRLAAGRMSPSCQEEVAERLQGGSESQGPVPPRVLDEALNLLRFRHEMTLELQS